jgi:general secretion pathway protein J
MRAVRGLTLIELLVALAIFSVLSGVAYRALTVVLESRGRIEQETAKWRELAMFFARVEQDFAAAAPRSIRDTGQRNVPAFMGNAAGPRLQEGMVLLTRTGFAADPAAVDPARRVGYRLRGGMVELLTWNVLDQAPTSVPRANGVLHGVQAMELRYLDRRGQSHATWPPAGLRDAATAIPAGVELAVTLTSGERITRLFATSVRLPE